MDIWYYLGEFSEVLPPSPRNSWIEHLHALMKMHRCFVIWNRKKWVLVFPALLMLAGAASGYTHAHIYHTTSHSLNTAQITDIVLRYLIGLDEVNPETIQVANRLFPLPRTLFPLLTTLTVTILSGESFTVILSKFFNLLLMVDFSFAYLVDQSSSKKDFG